VQKNIINLLWVRSFSTIYNPDLAIKILNEVRKKYSNCTLTMIGPDNGLLLETKKNAKELNLIEYIDFLGPIKNEELYHYYQNHSVYINTTSYESFGVALIEAASCGIPIVSSNVGEIPFLWNHEIDMLIVNDFNAKNFAVEIFKIIENEEFAMKMTENARAKSEKFNWDNINPQWQKLLTDNSK
jgi:glycosyltransferase involved in cell wall biosynthesis